MVEDPTSPDVEQSALDNPPVIRMTAEEVAFMNQATQEHNRHLVEYRFIWKNRLVLSWVPAFMGITCERSEGLNPIDVREKHPHLPNVNSVEELSSLAHQFAWRHADQIQALDLDTRF